MFPAIQITVQTVSSATVFKGAQKPYPSLNPGPQAVQSQNLALKLYTPKLGSQAVQSQKSIPLYIRKRNNSLYILLIFSHLL